LHSIARIEAKKTSFEVIVVNNNCNDNTVEICRQFATQHPDVPFRMVDEPQQGLGYARNRGIAAARGEVVAFIDDDAEVAPDYVTVLTAAFAQQPQYSSLGGKILPVFEGGKEPRWFSKYLEGAVAKVDLGDEPQRFPKKFPFGCNMAFRKCVFAKYGGFKGALSRADEKKCFFEGKIGGRISVV
jgi:glycosyltransferase involved in cell wall biosynthesis